MGDIREHELPLAGIRIAPTRTHRAQRRRRASWTLITALCAIGVALVVAIVGVLSYTALPGALARRHTLKVDVLQTDIYSGPVVPVVFGLCCLALCALAVRRWSVRRAVIAGCGLAAGVLAAIAVLLYSSVTDAFGVTLDAVTWLWAIATFGACGAAIALLWRANALQRLVAVAAIPAFLAAGTIGVNADFGLDRTIGDLVGTPVGASIRLPPAAAAPKTHGHPEPLWESWHPPKDMPAIGETGQVTIPATVSGFHPRPAGIYLPPAALVPHAPALPLMILMMGQPGSTDPSYVATAVNRFAATHHGLAPIIVVADQLGDPTRDSLCLNTVQFGNAETYITRDVVSWARSHLRILQDPAHWVIAGYSNGGECAISFGAKFPGLWNNVLDISGEAYPGSEEPNITLNTVFDGNRAAYESEFPATILAKHHYRNMLGIFTVGSNDLPYRAQAQQISAAARKAGWLTTYYEVYNGGHVHVALAGGFAKGFEVLYPRLGLSRPNSAPNGAG